jgi:single-stranded-DNA-specific exonuclease
MGTASPAARADSPGRDTATNVTAAQTPRRWIIQPEPPSDALAGTPYPPVVRRLLLNRGIATPEDARAFLEGIDPVDHDPFLLAGMATAVERLLLAARNGETVGIFGDFDVDGVTATAILTHALRSLGALVIPYLPHRFTEGYGLNVDALSSLHADGASVVVTADCGISSVDEIAHGSALGLDVIVLDHHTIPAVLPAAYAAVNPKFADSEYPHADLAGVGVAFKTVQALFKALGRERDALAYLDLAAIGTVADMVPLLDENRWIVTEGLRALRRTERPGLAALMEVAGVRPDRMGVDTIGYTLAPRLNAAGRLEHAHLAFDLLVTADPEQAETLARRLDELNRERQRQTQEAVDLCDSLLSEEALAPLVMVGHESVSSGIVGLVASRLAERLYRPAIVYERGETTSRASCRSIPEFDIVAALRTCADLLVRYGGHRQAAGFTVANEHLPELKRRLTEYARGELADVTLAPAVQVDMEVPLHGLRGTELRWLKRFAPCGIGNPEPTFMSEGVLVQEVSVIGNGGKHMRLRFRAGNIIWRAIAFGFGEQDVEPGDLLDIVYNVVEDRRGYGLELRIKDMRPSVLEG